ncbi:MAG: adenosylcobinamide-phosphate synthase CbiB [Aquabacterium sp.]
MITSWVLACMLAVVVAMVVDRLWGEPPAWAHPVVGMGWYLGKLGPALTRWPPTLAFLGGTWAWLLGAYVVGALGLCVELGVRWGMSTVMLANVPQSGGVVLAALLMGLSLKPLLAWRMLRDEVGGVETALGRSLPEGQAQLARLVSRDVSVLDDAAVRESAIETLAENLNDSLVAPLFWFALGGLPAAAVYRFANTADAMWGYRGRYEWSGKWAAHVDDILSWAPARMTALLLCLAAWRWPGWSAMRGLARLTPSPNGGWPMGTMALLLGVSLRKPGVYSLNEVAPSPTNQHTRCALRWAGRAAWAAAACCALFMVCPLLWSWLDVR